jgi:putative ABC transport system permease protein
MLKSFLKMAWRNLFRNKVSSLINIGGLAVGLTAGILIMLVVVDEFSYDKFQANLPELYQVMKNQRQMDGISTGSSTPGPLAASLRRDMPETKYVARACYRDELLRNGDKSLFGNSLYADADLFRMMSFPALLGDPVKALQETNTAVLTEQLAKKLFGNDNPVGKLLVLNNLQSLKVVAVIRDIPSNSTLQFDLALPFTVFEQQNPWLTKWDDNRIETWLQLKPTVNLAAFNERLTRLLQTRTADSTVSMFAYPMARLRLYRNFSNGHNAGGKIYMVGLISVIGLFILLIACINFMNLATARSEHRAREVGVRKVLGAGRRQIIFQFLGEALVMSFLALLVGMILSRLLLPAFNQYAGRTTPFDFGNGKIVVGLLAVGLFTGLVAGSYPALFLSRFKTLAVLKGVTTTGKKGGGLRRALVTLQFVISIFFIIGTIVIYKQIGYVRTRPLGYDQENLIDISATGDLSGNYNAFRNELANIPGVTEISAGSDNILQFGSGITGLNWSGKLPGQEMSILTTEVEYHWSRTMGIRMAYGRDFDPSFGADTSNCLLNQAAADKMGLKPPYIGARVGDKTVIGVFRNFVFNNPSGIIAPMLVSLNTGSLPHVYVRIRNDTHWQQTLSQIGKTAKKLNPDFPFDFSFTKEGYQKRFEEFSSMGLLVTIFGGIAIFISCLGLFGLSIFLAERRGKEMSIRKILGAGARSIWITLSGDFLKPVFIALLVAIPLAALVMQSFLSNIAYRVSLSWWMFAAAGLLAVLIALATVSFQGIRTALENPAKKLRSE